jgi:hypothetical protein
MDSSAASSVPERLSDLEEMPAELREALNEVHAAVEVLNRDQKIAITEQSFEEAADLRERAETLKRRKEKIIGEWQQMKAARGGRSQDLPSHAVRRLDTHHER